MSPRNVRIKRKPPVGPSSSNVVLAYWANFVNLDKNNQYKYWGDESDYMLTRTVFLPASFLYPRGGAEDESCVSEGRGSVLSFLVSEEEASHCIFLVLSRDLSVTRSQFLLILQLSPLPMLFPRWDVWSFFDFAPPIELDFLGSASTLDGSI